MEPTDKSDRFLRMSLDPEERLLLARVWDKYEQTERRGTPCATDFLSPREQKLALSLLQGTGVHGGYLLDGGYEGAERRRMIFLPDWTENDESQIAFLRADFHGPESLGHRDILGSLMGLGVVRGKIGDILISPHSADIIAAPSLRDFFLLEWKEAGHVKLRVSEIRREDLRLHEPPVKEVRDTVSSLRLDAVIAAAFSIARGKAVAYIRTGRVFLDHWLCEKPDMHVEEGAVITVRGLGRAKLKTVGAMTKKGRTTVIFEIGLP